MIGRRLLVSLFLCAVLLPGSARAEEVTAPEFAPFWVQVTEPASLWSGPRRGAALAELPQWHHLQVLAPQNGPRLLVWNPTSGDYGYVDADLVGPSAPPENAWLQPPRDFEALGVPARVIEWPSTYALPREDAAVLRQLNHNDPVYVQEALTDAEGALWYRIGDAEYIPARSVKLPRPAPRTFPGKWIDADLNEPTLVTAYFGDLILYSAFAVHGTQAWPTPTGTFRILRRVANETMDSQTIGIPRNAPGGYYLKDVLYTQYFTEDGSSIHYNYWKASWGYAGSHGCLGMNLEDSEWFWEWGELGVPVVVHY